MAEDCSGIKRQKEDNLAVGAKGGVIAFILQVTTMGLGFLNQIVLARILGAGGTGEVLLALSVVNISALIAAFGMQSAMVRFVPIYVEKGDNARLKGTIYFVLKFCLLLSLIFVSLILLLSRVISVNIFHSEGLLRLLPVVAVVVPVYVLNDVTGGILKGYKDTFRALLPHTVISPFFKLMIFLLLSLKGASPLYAIAAFISGELLAALFSLKFLFKKMGRDKPAYDRGEYNKIFDIASTLIFTSISVFLFSHADLWIVGIFASTEAVGIYGVVSRLVILIAFSLGAFSTIIPPIMSVVHASGDRNELQKVVSESTRWSLSISIPIILILILEGKFILKYAYGEKFADGYIALVILTIGQLINVGSGLVGWLLQMTGGHRTFMKITIFGGLLNIILNLILVPRFSIIGAALSTALSLSLVNIISVLVIYTKMSVLTLAKGLKFDIIFGIIVAIIYYFFNYKNFYLGNHFLLITALIVYICKSIVNGDLPLRYLLAKYRG